MEQLSLNNKAWEVLFDRHNILDKVKKDGSFVITANEIRKEREPRLMANFSHRSNLPELFKELDLAILPISRANYIIGEFDNYYQLNYSKSEPKKVYFPKNITTIDPRNLYSEGSALHCAMISGMLEDLIGEPVMQTVSGRMSSRKFNFRIYDRREFSHDVQVENAQIEIDGGYESKSKFLIIEAKNETVEDFLIRQLFYPYRLWKNKTYKEVHPVFFTHSNDVFSFFIFRFNDPDNYNSIQLIEQKDFILAHEKICIEEIKQLLNLSVVVKEPNIPFPQADSFIRIVDLLGLLVEEDLSKHEITSNYDFTPRQTNYYTDAARYLGLVEKYNTVDGQVMYQLSYKGRQIMGLQFKEKYLKLAQSILEHVPFRRTYEELSNLGYMPSKNRVVEVMKQCDLYNIEAESTYYRRARTVIRWIEWIISLTKK